MDLRKLKKTNGRNFEDHVQKFVEHAKNSGKDGLKFACEKFDEMLDSLADEDYFGTEQQCDPRGDPR